MNRLTPEETAERFVSDIPRIGKYKDILDRRATVEALTRLLTEERSAEPREAEIARLRTALEEVAPFLRTNAAQRFLGADLTGYLLGVIDRALGGAP